MFTAPLDVEALLAERRLGAMATTDPWAAWLLERRHGGDERSLAETLELLGADPRPRARQRGP